MKIIAHRCGTDRFPELTVASARHSLACGASLVEMDTRFTADGAVVICHDPSTLKLFGSDRKISEMALSEFLALRHVKDVSFCSHSLEHFLVCGIKDILFDVKEGGAENLAAIMALCEKYGCEKSVVWGVRHAGDVEYIKSRDAGNKVLAFAPVDKIEEFIAAGADFIRLWERDASAENFTRILGAGKKLWIMAKSPEHGGTGYTALGNLEKWRDMGADGVLLNEVENARI